MVTRKIMSLVLALSFIATASFAAFPTTAQAEDKAVELSNASVEGKSGEYKYDIELTFKIGRAHV